MQRCFAVLIAFLFVVFTSPQASAVAATTEDAAITASSWLTLVDGGYYVQSWQTASRFFRSAIAEATWAASLQAARSPLGSLVRREQRASQLATSLPGAPDGEYCILSFATELTNKKTAVETLTMMREADGQWRVAGYFIK
ncbi:hypothetical protein Despr_3121 [Desulfobulbus propionicus DSM 2032]|uniref:DUF4019 domain-containing protein n=1 Tax=Desulfobulbus propionicus (strain ATCC 33891 / DSM 2032 / VKM B-1956 / 1pr3) TaxID=577650 RepID=A0A7U3YPY0_DESPD|nr:DUF4019 domain-containing protein [Desulfobulbus propionicus]ADW19253.1 hypothetical protein Despr_3121 [Desulfobulbus propionicus DSM 2032]